MQILDNNIGNLINFSNGDFLIIGIYFLFLIIIGIKSSGSKSAKIESKKFTNNNHNSSDTISNEENYILAGRSLTLPLFVATLVSTWYGSILGVGEFVYDSGIVAWVSLGLPYYIAAFLYAIFISQKVRKLNVTSIPEQIENKFGRVPSLIASIFVLLLTLPGSYMLMLGFLLQLILGLNFYISLLIGALISVLFIYKGGFKSDVYLNVFQFVLMFVGFILLFIFASNKFGNPITLYNSLPQTHQDLSGGLNFQIIVVWFVIAFQTFIDPSFHQRCSAAKESKIARNGILVSILFWIFFDFLTLSCGLYAFKLVNLSEMGVSSVNSYPLLAEMVMPSVFKGLFFVSLLATVMSTLESYSFLSAITLGKDILQKINPKILQFKSNEKNTDTEKIIKFSFIITIVLSVILAVFVPSVINLMYNIASLSFPGLFLPILLTYSKIKLSENQAILLIILPVIASSIIMLLKYYQNPYFENIEAMIVGLSVSIILFLIIQINKKSKNEIRI